MKSLIMIAILALQSISFAKTNSTQPTAVEPVQLSEETSRVISDTLRHAVEKQGDGQITFRGSPEVTTYSIDNEELICYVQNNGGGADCYAQVSLSDWSSYLLASLLRTEHEQGNPAIKFEGNAQNAAYIAGEMTCYLNNTEKTASCAVNKK